MLKNNHAVLIGRIVEPLQPTHKSKAYNNNYYMAKVAAKRPSGTDDTIPVKIRESLLPKGTFLDSLVGETVSVTGSFQSYNDHTTGKSKLKLFLYAETLDISGTKKPEENNQIQLSGTICIAPRFKVTTYTKRRAAEFILAVDRDNRKSEYIPCVCWNKAAVKASGFPVGTKLKVRGIMQSREYGKCDKETHKVTYHTAYEISISQMEELGDQTMAQHIENLWMQFGDIPMDPETECLEQPFTPKDKQGKVLAEFPPSTHREDIWHWFEETFHISVAEDLMHVGS